MNGSLYWEPYLFKEKMNKDFSKMTFSEQVDYWTGDAILQLGRGSSLRGIISVIINKTMEFSYNKGYHDAKSI